MYVNLSIKKEGRESRALSFSPMRLEQNTRRLTGRLTAAVCYNCDSNHTAVGSQKLLCTAVVKTKLLKSFKLLFSGVNK
jgi:hypothetical protein